MSTDLPFHSLTELSTLLARGDISSRMLTQACLARIDALDARLHAFIDVYRDDALRLADAADLERRAHAPRGPLHGIPVALKDVFCTRGVRTTCGSTLFADHVPGHDSAVAEKLAAAGAVLIGKLNMHELAYGITSNNPHFGAVRNPWNTGCVPGGSSGGSGAAVAAGMVFMAMGTDTGGSIRIPASFCGTVGLKPTFGRVSRYGVLPLDFSLDHMGPLTRSVRDAAVVLEAIAGFDPRDDTSSRRPVESYVPADGCSIQGLRIGVPRNFYCERVEPDVASAVAAALDRAAALGARLVPLRVPDIAAINAVGRVILLAEASALMEPHLDRRDRFGADVLALFDQGRLLPATDYVNAQRLRRLAQREFRKLWTEVDCLFIPTTPNTAPAIGQATLAIDGEMEDVRLASTRFVRGINVLGLPALSLPCGLDERGLPIGLQIVGPEFAEATVLRAGAALEDSGLGVPECPMQ
jgi:aspartyl-tRNA(Asn)/glutamyl-tRNA(Gln) amidotransferase subunit A